MWTIVLILKHNPMKKIYFIFTLLMAFAIHSNAQQHWTPVGGFDDNMDITGVILIDGVEQTSTALELGAFCGDECRGSANLTYEGLFNRYYLYLAVGGVDGDSITFRLYDHALSQELDLICSNVEVFEANKNLGVLADPYVFDFVTVIVTHTITAVANPLQGGSVEGAGDYSHGSTCTLTATASTGYSFVNWTENDVQVSDEATYSFMVTGDRTLVANFTNETIYHTITVTASPNEGGTVTGGGDFELGTQCTVTATANDGYAFENWTENGNQVSAQESYTFTVSHDRNLVAHFEALSDDYHWYVNTHTYNNTMNITAVIQIDGVEQARNTLELGAFCNGECRGRERLIYDAIFGRYFLYLTIYGDNGDVLNFRLYDHEAGEELNLLNYNDMTFVAGSTYGSVSSPYVFNFLNTITTHTITAMANPAAGGTVTGAGSYDYGTNCTLTAMANEGYTFSNWTENGAIVSYETSFTFMVTGDRTFVANFTDTPVNYTVTLAANPVEGGSVTGAGDYQQGTEVTVTATANDGYAFVNWTDGSEIVSTNANYTFTLTHDRTLTANFEVVSSDYHWYVNTHTYTNTMTATAIIQIDGVEQARNTLEMGAFCGSECRGRERLTYEEGASRYVLYLTMYGNNGDALTFSLYDHELGQELDLLNYNNMIFTSGDVIGSLINPYVFNFLTAVTSHTITATANPVAGGTVSGAGDYNYGATCTLTATANEGYTFMNWTEGDAILSLESTLTFMVTGDRTLVANFTDETIYHTVTVAADPVEGGTVTGEGVFEHGQSVTVTATANDGYVFTYWTEGGVQVSSSAEYTFTLNQDRNLVANFEEQGDYHWYVDTHAYPNTMSVTAIIDIDGIEQHTTNLELGVFCGSECRGRQRPVYNDQFDRYLLFLDIYGNDGDYFTFRLYNHVTQTEMTEYLNFNEMTFVTGATIGNGLDPYVFNFLTELVMHTITVTANPPQGGTVAGNGQYYYGTDVMVTATPADGYVFVNWTENDVEVCNTPAYTFMVTRDRALVANFTDTPVDYTVTVAANPTEGGTVTGGGTYSQGTEVTVTATANDGYAFNYWSENGVQVSTNATYTFTLNGDRNLVANFEVVSGEYHWYVNTHQYANNMTATAIIEIDGVEQPLSTLELGAFCGDECRGRERLTYDGMFNRYLLYLTMYGNDGDNFTFRLYNHATEQELTSLTNFNTMTFVTGATLGDPINPYVFDFRTSITQHNIVATANPVSGGTITGTGTFDYGSTCTLTATPNLGFAFVDWTEGGVQVSTDATYTFMVTGDRTLVANFTDTPVDYTVTVTANPTAGGMVTGGGLFVQGTNCTVNAIANEGYIFSNWTENNTVVSTDAEYTFTIQGDRDLVANFTEVSSEYHWYVNPNQFASNMSVQGVIFIDGVEQMSTTLELGAFCNGECRGRELPIYQPLVGQYFYFLQIYGNDGDEMEFHLYDHATSQVLDYTCFEHITFVTNGDYGDLLNPYHFNFVSAITSHTITVTANPAQGGMVSGGGVFDYGTECTVTAAPAVGFAFTDWKENGETVSIELSYTFMVTGDRNLVANFTDSPVNYNITVTATEGGTASGGGEYLQGSECTVTATAADGYVFVNWTVNGTPVSTDAVYTFVVNGNLTLEAHFIEIPQGYHWYVNPQLYANNIGVTGIIQIDSVPQTSIYLEVGAFCGSECRGREKPMEIFNPLVGHYVYLVFLQVYGEPGDLITFKLYDHIQSQELNLICTSSIVFTQGGDTGDIINPYLFNFLSVMPFEITATANPVEGGTVSGAGTYEMGSTCTLTATANPGYTFANWTNSEDVVVTDNPELSFTVTENASYTANFTQDIYQITASAVPVVAGEITGAGEYLYGETCTLTVAPSVFYEFLSWSKNGIQVSEELSFSFIVTESAHYEAIFDPKSVTQTTELTSGWNWYSSYIEMDDINGKDSLEMHLGNHGMMIKSQNSGYDTYLAGWGWYGSLDSIHNECMYMVKTSEPCEIGINGLIANVADHPITLGYGLSWIGYPVTFDMSVEDAFSGFTSSTGDILKSQGYGYCSYLEGWGWYGSLSTLLPGMGMMYKSMNSESITFTYPDTPTQRDLKPNITAEHNHFVPNLFAYPFNMTVTAVVELDDQELQGENYELAAFANGECRGSARLIYVEPLDRYIAFLTVAGEEAFELRFGLYDAESGMECFDTNVTLIYANDANIGSLEQPFVVSFRGNTGVDEWTNRMQVYPNPVEHGQRLTLDLTTDEAGEVRIEIVNALGAVIETVNTPSQLTTLKAPETAGVYTLRITAEGKGTCHRKLIVR